MLLVAHGSLPAYAQSDDATSRARTHYEAGRALYNLGNYSDAAREFLAGYQLAPRREFLINLGQTYRKLEDLPRAHGMYTKYLEEAPADDARRDWVRKQLADVDKRIRDAGGDPNAPPAPAPSPEPSPIPAVAASPAAAAPAATTDAPPKKSFIRRHWWIIPVSAVVAAGIGVGIYFAVRPPDPCAGAQIDCIMATGMNP